MNIRRKIAGALRGLARRIDDDAKITRADVDARVAASMAIPRRVNRYVEVCAFDNKMPAGGYAFANPLVVRVAAEFERVEPGLYAGNTDMEAAIARLRGPSGSDLASMTPRPTFVQVEPLAPGIPLPEKLMAVFRHLRRPGVGL